MKKIIRLLIADDHSIVRIGLTSLFENESDIEVVGQAVDGLDAVSKVDELLPDVVLIDLMMPKMDGTEATAAIKAKHPEIKIILLTTFSSANGLFRAIDSGADGALTKSVEDASLVATVRKVADGEKIISPEIQKLLAQETVIPELSPRQKEVLSSVTRGLSNADIAAQLGIEPLTVREYLSTIFAKLGAANRAEAAAIAMRKLLLKI